MIDPKATYLLSGRDLLAFANHLLFCTKKGTYSVEETCERLKVSRSTLWRMEVRGELKSKKIGGKKHFYASEVEKLI